MKDFADLIMESFVEIIDSIAKSNNIKKGQFAVSVWPDMPPKVAERRWLFMRKKSYDTGHPQGVTLADAYRLAKALDQDLAYILLRATARAEEKQASGQKEEKAGKSGKPGKAVKKSATTK